MIDASPLVSVIVVNYRKYKFLNDCLDSILKSSYKNIEIIVIDNDSDESSLARLRTKFPKILFFGLKENLKYSEGNNFGLAKSRGDFVVMLNNDTIVHEGWLEPLIACGIENCDAFYQPLIVFMDDSKVIGSLGNAVHPLGFAFPIGIGKRIIETDTTLSKKEVFYCSGACVFACRTVFDRLGGLDSNYWTYYEDVNLGWRGRLIGISSFVVPKSMILHSWGGSYGQTLSPNKLYLLERGRLSSILRNYSSASLVLLLPLLFLSDSVMFFFLLQKPGLARAKMKASKDVLLSLEYLFFQRKMLQATRVVGDNEILSLMNPSMVHPYINSLTRNKGKLLTLFSKILISLLLHKRY